MWPSQIANVSSRLLFDKYDLGQWSRQRRGSNRQVVEGLPSADLAESDDALIERLLGQLSIVPIAFGKPEPLSSVQGDITQVTFTVPFTSAPNAFDYKLTQYIHQGMDKELGDRLDGLSNG